LDLGHIRKRVDQDLAERVVLARYHGIDHKNEYHGAVGPRFSGLEEAPPLGLRLGGRVGAAGERLLHLREE